jgi:hypothetical protein
MKDLSLISRFHLTIKGVLVAFRDSDMKFPRLLFKYFLSENMGKNKLIRSIFILIGHQISILIAIRKC